MEQNIIPAKKQPDELTIKQIVLGIKAFNAYLLKKWLIISVIAFLGALIGAAYAYFKSTTYTAECTFVLQEGGEQGSLGQYSALASMVGIDVGGTSGLFQGDNIIELYKSRLMLEKTLLTPANFGSKRQMLIDRYIDFNKLREGWSKNPKLKYIDFNAGKEKFTLQHDSIVGLIVNDLIKNYLNIGKPDKKLSIISVKTRARDELFAKAFTEQLVANVNDFYIATKTKGSLQNMRLLQRQSDSIRRVLNASISGTAAAMDANPNPNPAMQILRAPSQKKQVDVQSNSAIYTEVVKNLEISRGMLQRETPLIQIIDKPVLPLVNDKTGKFKAAITGGLLGAFIGIFVIAIIKMYRKLIA